MLSTMQRDNMTKRDHVKRLVDVLIAFVLFVFSSPLWLVVAVAVKLTSRGPLFYKQLRVGQNGNLFFIYKFRTMVHNADRHGPSVTALDDSRVTRAGRLLRNTKLDEIPQLINVLKGDMSLVGPRPQVPQFVQHFEPTLRDIVLRVRPGITGPTALHFRHEEHLLADKTDREGYYIEQILPVKLKMDANYVETSTLRDDLRILKDTVKILLGGAEAKTEPR